MKSSFESSLCVHSTAAIEFRMERELVCVCSCVSLSECFVMGIQLGRFINIRYKHINVIYGCAIHELFWPCLYLFVSMYVCAYECG